MWYSGRPDAFTQSSAEDGEIAVLDLVTSVCLAAFLEWNYET